VRLTRVLEMKRVLPRTWRAKRMAVCRGSACSEQRLTHDWCEPYIALGGAKSVQEFVEERSTTLDMSNQFPLGLWLLALVFVVLAVYMLIRAVWLLHMLTHSHAE
jgi:hypothetical protein